MTGPGHVEPGGAPLVGQLPGGATLVKVSVGPMDNNAYLLSADGDSVLIDAANDDERLLALIGDAPVSTIVTTHRHGDHIQALADVAEATGARLVAGHPDLESIERDAGVSGVTGVWDGDTVPLGETSLEVVGLVGHTPGSITLVYAPAGGPVHLFTGDSLFPGGPGKTWRAADFTSLMDDIEAKLFDRFGDDTVVHPGHGDDTTLGVERPQLDAWRARGW
ncbi:MBL fold metallo-hydrolase [Microlunatus ginsengisoli]|uniref:MBL fold metallo-hydrolase n=1 Tax=Microlunatus ginsengisoli TaxID=363863 RepID=A0ABP6ZHY0_9ACTN